MASSECLYEVLGVNRDCTADQIRSAYKRLALQRHPDKLLQTGVPEAEATAAFQELVHAYEILMEAHKRAWYDSHRSRIVSSSMSGPTYSSNLDSLPNLFTFFSKRVYSGYSDKENGFYKVYGDLFEKIYMNELNSARKLGLKLPKKAPRMGNLDSPYAQATTFYSYWLEFVTVMDFCWDDQQKDYNETVRALAKLVERRDKRVIDMQKKRDEEKKRKKEKERLRKDKLEKLKVEKAKKFMELEIEEDERADDDFYPNFEEDERDDGFIPNFEEDESKSEE